MLEIVDRGILSHVPGRGAYFPCVRVLQDGSMLAAQHVGSGLCCPDNHIEVLRSMDGDATGPMKGASTAVSRRMAGATGPPCSLLWRMETW